MAENDHRAEAVQAALIADLLGSGRSLDLWSMAFALLAGLGMLIAAAGHDRHKVMLFGAVVLVALVQKYLALRTRLDAAIFRRWAENWRLPAGSPAEDMEALDRALGKEGAGFRSLAERVHGARRLLAKQAVCLVIQVLGFLLGLGLGT